MLVKDLPEGTDLRPIKIRLPDDVLRQYQEYAGGEKEMYVVGATMGDFFLSPIPPNTRDERIMYPMPPAVEPSHILDWEVVEEVKG